MAALAAVAVIAALWLWPRNLYTYQGRTVEEWFREWCGPSAPGIDPTPGRTIAGRVFREMGTNAVPFLASQLLQDADYSVVESCRIKVHGWLPSALAVVVPAPADKGLEMMAAADVLSLIKAPLEMLLPLLAPALSSKDRQQKMLAVVVMSGLNSIDPDQRTYVQMVLAEGSRSGGRMLLETNTGRLRIVFTQDNGRLLPENPSN